MGTTLVPPGHLVESHSHVSHIFQSLEEHTEYSCVYLHLRYTLLSNSIDGMIGHGPEFPSLLHTLDTLVGLLVWEHHLSGECTSMMHIVSAALNASAREFMSTRSATLILRYRARLGRTCKVLSAMGYDCTSIVSQLGQLAEYYLHHCSIQCMDIIEFIEVSSRYYDECVAMDPVLLLKYSDSVIMRTLITPLEAIHMGTTTGGNLTLIKQCGKALHLLDTVPHSPSLRTRVIRIRGAAEGTYYEIVQHKLSILLSGYIHQFSGSPYRPSAVLHGLVSYTQGFLPFLSQDMQVSILYFIGSILSRSIVQDLYECPSITLETLVRVRVDARYFLDSFSSKAEDLHDSLTDLLEVVDAVTDPASLKRVQPGNTILGKILGNLVQSKEEDAYMVKLAHQTSTRVRVY